MHAQHFVTRGNISCGIRTHDTKYCTCSIKKHLCSRHAWDRSHATKRRLRISSIYMHRIANRILHKCQAGLVAVADRTSSIHLRPTRTFSARTIHSMLKWCQTCNTRAHPTKLELTCWWSLACYSVPFYSNNTVSSGVLFACILRWQIWLAFVFFLLHWSLNVKSVFSHRAQCLSADSV